jgi:hypothetical protein
MEPQTNPKEINMELTQPPEYLPSLMDIDDPPNTESTSLGDTNLSIHSNIILFNFLNRPLISYAAQMQVRTILRYRNNIRSWKEEHMDVDGEEALEDMEKRLDEEEDLYSGACEKLTTVMAEWLGSEGDEEVEEIIGMVWIVLGLEAEDSGSRRRLER